MISFFKKVLRILESAHIPYIIGADSLAGLAEGDLFKYSHNLRLYVFPLKKHQWFLLALRFLRYGILMKPKKNQGNRFYKLRFNSSPLTKLPEFVHLTLLTPGDKCYCAFVGGHNTFYSTDNLNLQSIEFIDHDGVAISVPKNYPSFVNTYNKELMAGFYKKHSVSFDSKSEQKAIQFMHENIAIMNDAGIDFWIEGGTLLGALRDQKLIPWDHDLDFGMKFKSHAEMKQLIRKLRRQFYVSVKDFPKNNKIWMLGDYRVLKIYPRKNLLFKEELCLDLFVYYEGQLPDSKETVYKYVVWNRNAYHRKEFLETSDTMVFYGKEVPIPAHAEKFIEVKYGKDWRTPIKEWNVALDDGSIYKPD